MNAWLRTLWQRIWGVRPWGSSKGGQSWRMFPFRESGCCLWGSNSNISCPLWCLLHLNVSLCSHLISRSTFQLGIPNHTLFFQDKYARGGIYYYSSILNTWGKVLVNSHFSLIIIIKHHDNGEKRWILGLMPVISWLKWTSFVSAFFSPLLPFQPQCEGYKAWFCQEQPPTSSS